MTLNFFGAMATGLVVAAATGLSPTNAGAAVIDFENIPSLSAGPSIYVAVPGPRTITTVTATFSGGVVLGFATFFPAISEVDPKNWAP